MRRGVDQEGYREIAEQAKDALCGPFLERRRLEVSFGCSARSVGGDDRVAVRREERFEQVDELERVWEALHRERRGKVSLCAPARDGQDVRIALASDHVAQANYPSPPLRRSLLPHRPMPVA